MVVIIKLIVAGFLNDSDVAEWHHSEEMLADWRWKS